MQAMAEDQQLARAMARLDALTNWESRPRATMRVGLEPMLDLARRLGDPQNSFRSIHVAGTKGKGSVSALIEAALARAGLCVGRYASPHVERITERVTLEGREIDEASLARALDKALDAYEAAREAGSPAARRHLVRPSDRRRLHHFRRNAARVGGRRGRAWRAARFDQHRRRRNRRRHQHRARAHRDSGQDARGDRAREGRHPQAWRRARHLARRG